MREEISAAVLFLTRLIEKGENFNHDQIEHFKLCLSETLVERFENHWFPDKPDKGQGYRCIRVNGVNRREPAIEKAALASGIKYEDMKLPCELTIWVDPNEVCCRFGEHKGSFCTLASFSDKEGSSSGEESQGEESSKTKNSPLTTPRKESIQMNSLSGTKGRKGSGQIGNTGSSPVGGMSKQGKGGLLRRGGVGGFQHHQMNPWYNLISPPWLPPSPPPYHHPQLRSHPPHKWSPHHPHRYHWPAKSTLKV